MLKVDIFYVLLKVLHMQIEVAVGGGWLRQKQWTEYFTESLKNPMQ